MSKTSNKVVAMSAPVEIIAAEGGDEGEKKPAKFSVLAYTGKAIRLGGWEHPVVVDMDGMGFGNSLVANLDHISSQRVGHVTGKSISNYQLTLDGNFSAATEHRREVLESAGEGFVWQASIEASADMVSEVKDGTTVNVNGQDFEGPLYVVSKSTLKGFAFVSHGADDNTTVSIAATADTETTQEKAMEADVKAWAESMGIDVENVSDEQAAKITANFQGHHIPPKAITAPEGLKDGAAKIKAEHERKQGITNYALQLGQRDTHLIDAYREMAEQAIAAGDSLQDFKVQIMEAGVSLSHAPESPLHGDKELSNRVLEAAVCQAGNIDDLEKNYSDRELQAAHDKFKGRIGLNQLLMMSAKANGYRDPYASQVTPEVLQFAFNAGTHRQIHATSGFSTINISSILSNVANKFLRRGWNAIDMTPLRIAPVRNVRDFKQITTVSLVADAVFDQIGPAGEIKHGTMSEVTYNNKADTYAKMLAITRQDIINDDMGALTDTPMKLGRGAALKLNDIFWAEFLNNGTFFSAANGNLSNVVGALSIGGLEAAETLFLLQTNPDGSPLGLLPEILLVPPALKHRAMRYMNSDRVVGGTADDTPEDNVFAGRFRVESSPYMQNAAYTGNSAAAWYLLAGPDEMPVIEIAALNGRVEPVVETTDAQFNTLGIQMRGYSDVGVAKQEYRGGVRATG